MANDSVSPQPPALGDMKRSLGVAWRWLAASTGWRFLRLLGGELWRDELPERAATLAYITVVSLVPFLAALSLVAGPAPDEESAFFLILTWLLPYSETTILGKLREFVDQARAIRGVGLIAFLITALTAFFTIDHAINRIFKVNQRRPFPARFRSFSLVLFWAPVMVAVTSSSLYLLESRETPAEYVAALLAVLPFTVTVLGLTMLYWLVPFTEVRFRSAFTGATIAAILLELLRKGFGLYIGAYEVNRIYGSFGLVILFLVSIQLGWLLVLAGCELAYCLDTRRTLWRRTASADSSDAGWMGLAALLFAFHRLCRGKPIVARGLLADRLHLAPPAVDEVLDPLVRAGHLVPSSDGGGYLLAGDPHALAVEDVFAVYDRTTGATIADFPDPLGPRLEALRGGLGSARREHLAGLTIAEAAGRLAEGSVAKGDGVPYNSAPRVGQ